MNGTVRDVSFTPDGRYLLSTGSKFDIHYFASVLTQSVSLPTPYTHTHTLTHTHPGDGKVYVWDMSTRDCVHCFTDEGCLLGTKLAVSPSGTHIACGCDSGVVNVYSGEQCLRTGGDWSTTAATVAAEAPAPKLSPYPKPLKSIRNLTTAIDQVCFNSTR